MSTKQEQAAFSINLQPSFDDIAHIEIDILSLLEENCQFDSAKESIQKKEPKESE